MKNICKIILGHAEGKESTNLPVRALGQAVTVFLLGCLWLGNSVAIGELTHPNLLAYTCTVGSNSPEAYYLYAAYGFPIAAILVAAFGFLACWTLNGRYIFFANTLFLLPALVLVGSMFHWSSFTYWYFPWAYMHGLLLLIGILTVIASIVGTVFSAGFYYHRRLIYRCTGRLWPNRDDHHAYG